MPPWQPTCVAPWVSTAAPVTFRFTQHCWQLQDPQGMRLPTSCAGLHVPTAAELNITPPLAAQSAHSRPHSTVACCLRGSKAYSV